MQFSSDFILSNTPVAGTSGREPDSVADGNIPKYTILSSSYTKQDWARSVHLIKIAGNEKPGRDVKGMKERGNEMSSQHTAIGLQVSADAAAVDAKYVDDYCTAQAIADGDRARFKEIYDRNSAMFYNLARRLADSPAEAEDIVQDAFVRAYQKIHMFAGRSTLSSWLYRICLNVGLEHLRRKKGTFSSEDIRDSALPASEPDQKKLILRQKLERAIKQLPDGCRTVFILHDIEGFNHKEIARQLGLAEGTSKSQLFKARAMLRRILTGRER